MRRFCHWFFSRPVLVALAVAVALSAPARAGDTAAENFVRALAQELSRAGALSQSDPGAGRRRVLAIFDRAFDMRAMALSALPEEYRNRADPGYVEAYTGYLADGLVAETVVGAEGRTEILGSRMQGARLVLVGTKITADTGQTRSVEWYLTPVAGGYRVINAAVSGVLVTAEQARGFRPHLISGDMPGLMSHLIGGAG